jgi:hypothetical protein
VPKFNLLCRVDAYVDYVAEVEADDAEEAAQLANQDFSGRYTWEQHGTQEFDARLYITLDENGDEIDGTQAGDG